MAIISSVTTITPVMAKELLEKNHGNRPLRKAHVAYLANMIKNGYFQTNHQGIAISKNGKLIDGQHRLMACIVANQPIEIMVSHGFDDDVFKTIDCGAARSISDRTGLNQKTAEVTKYLLRVGLNVDASKNADINLNLFNSGIGDIHNDLIQFCSTTRKIFSCAQTRAAVCILIFTGHDKNYVFDIYKNLVHLNISLLSPIGVSFFKQHIDKKHTGFSLDIYSKALKVFDSDYKDTQRVVCSDIDIKNASSFTKTVIQKALNI